MKDPKNGFVLAGDWHGNIHQAFNVVEYTHSENIDTIVQVGDFGITHYDREFLNRLQELLVKYSISLYFVDGNKDFQPKLYAIPANEDGTKSVRENIYYLPRGYRWRWNDFSFLALGGAPSINYKKNPSHIWCREEYITQRDIDASIAGGTVDFLISHDSPAGIENSVDDDGNMDAIQRFGYDAMTYCRDHRELLRYVTDKVTPRFMAHGHYHRYMKSYARHNYGSGPTTYSIGLDQGSAPIKYHAWAVNFSKLQIFKDQLVEMDTKIAV